MKYAGRDSLTLAQKARLADFRKSLPLPRPSEPAEGDKQLVNILRRSQWDLPLASRTYTAYMRESSRAKRLLAEPSEVMKEIIVSAKQTAGFVYLWGRTVDGNCVVIANLGKLDLNSHHTENYIDSILYVLDTLLLQNPADRWVAIADLTSVAISPAPAKALSI